MSALAVVAAAIAGGIIGSFLATLCIRWPRGEQAAGGRSHCDSCGRVLKARELVPVLSWAVSRGRCRSCGARISLLHPAIEAAAALLAACAVAISPDRSGVVLALLWLLLLAPAVLDARQYWLPDRLTLVLAACGLVLGGLLWGEPLLSRLIGGIAGFAALAALAAAYRALRGIDGLGRGDPKFFGAIGLWTGWQALPPILLLASAAGLAVAIAQGRRRLARMPFGTCLAVGTIVWTGAVLARR